MLDLAGIAIFEGPAPTPLFEPQRPLTGTVELSEPGRWSLAHAELPSSTGFKYRAVPQNSTTVHELNVTLDGVAPPLWRHVVVPSRLSLGDLHRVLQIVLGWEDHHLHQFRVGDVHHGTIDDELEDWGPPTLDEDLAWLGDVSPTRRTFSYEYDFGDSWEHTIKVRSITPIPELGDATALDVSSSNANPEIPRCTAGARACPPEAPGGTKRCWRQSATPTTRSTRAISSGQAPSSIRSGSTSRR
jgi:hypothetical protein